MNIFKSGLLQSVVLVSLFALVGRSVLASSTSENYQLINGGVSVGSGDMVGSGTAVKCFNVGDLAVGESSGSSYTLQHGVICPDVQDSVISFRCLPGNRFRHGGSLDYTSYVTIEVRPVGGTIYDVIFSEMVQTDANGDYDSLLLSGVNPGFYDVTCKGWNTLRLKLENVYIDGSNRFLDFSQGGGRHALAGDVDDGNEGSRGLSNELGDNEINAADYSIMVDHFNRTPGVSEARYDLDAFGGNVSAADYSIVTFNYNSRGE